MSSNNGQAAEPVATKTSEEWWCPDCLDGRRYPRCERCEGRGTSIAGHECSSCKGAGEVLDPKPCETCGGTGKIAVAWGKIREAVARRGGRAGEEAVVRLDPEEDPLRGWRREEVYEQNAHGATDPALVAYAELRDRIRGKKVGFSAIRTYLVPGWDGKRDVVSSAVALTTDDPDGLRLWLTGVSWGYGGEGPNGLAVILVDVGAFETHDAALSFVSRKPMASSWSLDVDRPTARRIL